MDISLSNSPDGWIWATLEEIDEIILSNPQQLTQLPSTHQNNFRIFMKGLLSKQVY